MQCMLLRLLVPLSTFLYAFSTLSPYELVGTVDARHGSFPMIESFC